MQKESTTQQVISSEQIGEKIRERRLEVGLSQEGLAELLGVSYQQVQRYERGSNRLSIERLQQISGALNVPVRYFLDAAFVAETTTHYLVGDAARLMTYFQHIDDPKTRQLVIDVTRLAASKSSRVSR